MAAIQGLGPDVGIQAACRALVVPPASYYRWIQPPFQAAAPRPRPPLALSATEEQEVLGVLHSERFADVAPPEIYATLLEEQTYLCSTRTMYRILDRNGEVRERRNQLRHPQVQKPELLATAPNQVWSWDITKLKGPEKWTYFYLYVILDIYSRYVVGWMLAHRESAELAKRLIRETLDKEGIEQPSTADLTIHSDRGPSMTSKTLGQFLADLAITRSLTRPYTSNDNPYSEAHFRTLKYRPGFPQRFGSLEHGLSFGRSFFPWYNEEHRHGGIGFFTPAQVHHGEIEAVMAQRERALHDAFAVHPERFKGQPPRPPVLPTEVWINPPTLDRNGDPSTRSRQHLAIPHPTCATLDTTPDEQASEPSSAATTVPGPELSKAGAHERQRRSAPPSEPGGRSRSEPAPVSRSRRSHLTSVATPATSPPSPAGRRGINPTADTAVGQ